MKIAVNILFGVTCGMVWDTYGIHLAIIAGLMFLATSILIEACSQKK